MAHWAASASTRPSWAWAALAIPISITINITIAIPTMFELGFEVIVCHREAIQEQRSNRATEFPSSWQLGQGQYLEVQSPLANKYTQWHALG